MLAFGESGCFTLRRNCCIDDFCVCTDNIVVAVFDAVVAVHHLVGVGAIVGVVCRVKVVKCATINIDDAKDCLCFVDINGKHLSIVCNC